MAVLVIVFIADFLTAPRVAAVKVAEGETFKNPRGWFNCLVCALLLAHLLINIGSTPEATTFSGMYITNGPIGVIKTILAFGTLIVLIQSREWMSRPDTFFKEGEFYLLTLSTLLGMNFMVSANHFLLFFLGLELASVPMACLVALDKYRHNSAEAGAKFIITATFSSGVMLYGISLLYGATGTLYFEDMAAALTATPLTIVGMVFFFSGLGFKLSLVPFHFWTADSYQAVHALHRDSTLHHGSQPLRHPSERPEALHGLQFYLTGGLHRAGHCRQRRDECQRAQFLRIDLHRCQHGCLHHHLFY